MAVYPEDVAEFVKNIPIEEFPGVGRSFVKLSEKGIKTLGECLN